MATSPYGNLMNLRNVTHAVGGVPYRMQGQSNFPPVHAVGPAGGMMGSAGGGYMPPNMGMGGAYGGYPTANPVGPAGGFMGSASGSQPGSSIPGTGMGGIYSGQPVGNPVGPAGGQMGGWGQGFGGVHAVGPEPYGGGSGYGGLGIGARPVGPAQGNFGSMPNYQNLMMLHRMGY